MRWAVGVGAAIMSAIGLVLLFLLTLATNNRDLYERNFAWLLGVNVLVALVLLAVFAYPLLAYWMDEQFARNGAAVLALMALSQFVDSLTSLPSLVNDGMGHPRVTGLFAVTRALAGVAIVYAGVAGWGIAGAAWGHLGASILFTLAFLAYVHGRTVPTSLLRLCTRAYVPGMAGAAGVALAASLAEHWFHRGALDFALILASTLALLGLAGMLFVVEGDDRRWAWARVKALGGG